MAGDIGANDGTATLDEAGRLSQISCRTCVMALDQVLRHLPHPDSHYAVAASELQVLARRMLTTTRDFAEALHGLT